MLATELAAGAIERHHRGMGTVAEALALAIEHHQAGRLASAEQIYRQILALEPDQADALNLLGVLAQQVGNPQRGIELIERAISQSPNEPSFHSNLGFAFHALGRSEQAIACYRRAIALKPDFAEAHNNQALVLQQQGKYDEAAACLRRAVEIRPDYAEAHNNLGQAYQAMGALDEAAACYRRALEFKPDYAEAISNLGTACKQRGELEQAIACYQRALTLRPEMPEGHYNLGNALYTLGRLQQAESCFRRAIELKPGYVEAYGNLGLTLCDLGRNDEAAVCYRHALQLAPAFADAHNNLGSLLQARGNLDEAIACYERALAISPDHSEVLSNLGNALKAQGRTDDAIACYRKALAIEPELAGAHSNLLYTLYASPEFDERAIYREHRLWNERHAAPLTQFIQPHAKDRSPERRLRIGYVSADFHEHVVGRFMLPLLECHDREQFEVYCYASVRKPDGLTELCRQQADVWRSVVGMSDQQLADRIRSDRIDILIDLGMHTAGNRLLALARKPAPVQVCYLAYPGTTGLTAIDYRLTDPYLDPPGRDERAIYSERSIHLQTYWCYPEPPAAPKVNPLPALDVGYVTFGCLNSFAKASPLALATWLELLRSIPTAKLLLHCESEAARRSVSALFAGGGISPERLTFIGRVPLADYFRTYQQVDIALDPFPHAGGTTTCDALWMGVPVVTLAGRTALGRGGVSILSNAGLGELIARNREQYVAISRQLAADLPRLATLRSAMRERMLRSPLMDAPPFARSVEAAYRQMWRQWCAAAEEHGSDATQSESSSS